MDIQAKVKNWYVCFDLIFHLSTFSNVVAYVLGLNGPRYTSVGSTKSYDVPEASPLHMETKDLSKPQLLNLYYNPQSKHPEFLPLAQKLSHTSRATMSSSLSTLYPSLTHDTLQTLPILET